MIRYVGGSAVERGTYLDTRSFAVVRLRVGGRLPGPAEHRFLRVPWPVLLLASPVVGGAFVLAYPLVGLATLAWGLARKAVAAASGSAGDRRAAAGPGRAAGEARLPGRRAEGGPAPAFGMEEAERQVRPGRRSRRPRRRARPSP